MTGTKITITGKDGSFDAYLASPAGGTGPGIIVIQEIFGVNANLRAIADRYASLGYFALAPDLFWRIERNVDITDQSEAEWKKAFDLFNKFKADTGITDIQASIDHLRKVKGVTGKVGTVGYCLGGLLAYLCATRTDTDASVSYYGVAIPNYVAEKTNIKKPLLMHVAAKDEYVPPAQQAVIAAELGSHSHVTVMSYAGQDHAFTRVKGAHYHADAACVANAATEAFFARHLR